MPLPHCVRPLPLNPRPLPPAADNHAFGVVLVEPTFDPPTILVEPTFLLFQLRLVALRARRALAENDQHRHPRNAVLARVVTELARGRGGARKRALFVANWRRQQEQRVTEPCPRHFERG